MISNIGFLIKTLLLQVLIVSIPLNSALEFDEELQSLVEQVSVEVIIYYIEKLAGFKTRYALTEKCNMSAEFLYRSFSSLEGFNVSFHYFGISSTGRHGMNVVAFKNGTEKNNEYVLLFAHYDSISGDPYFSAPGADDNACGVAVMMEVASIVSRYSWNRTLFFIAFSDEELGLLGSAAWIRDNEEILSNAIAAICLDGIGRG